MIYCRTDTGYLPEYEGDTSGPYYANLELVRADDKRMIGLEKAQNAQTLRFQLIGFAVLVLAFCFSL